MKTVKITYTTKAEFAAQNQKNIEAVMNDLKNGNSTGIKYSAHLSADGKTFIHFAFFDGEESQKALSELPSFRFFQEQLKASGLETPPKQEILNFIGSSYSIFN